MVQHTNRPHIVFYDTRTDAANLQSLSFYLNGFMENQDRLGYTFEIKRAIPNLLNLTNAQRQSLAIGFFRYALNGEQLYFCIDRTDSNYSIHPPDLAMFSAVDIVFKGNYHAENIRSKIADNTIHKKIIPISHSFPVALTQANRYAFNTLPLQADWSIKRAKNRLKYLIQPSQPKLDAFCSQRYLPRDMDVFFVMRHYDQDHHSEVARFRAEIMFGLKALQKRNIETGLVSRSALPAKWKDLHFPMLDMSDYLSRLTRAKVTIYIRGPHDCISSKFGQYLALGKPIVGQTLKNCRKELMANPYFDQQFVHHTPEGIVAAVHALLNDAERMEVWGKSNANVFDRTLNPLSAVGYMLREINKRLGA